MLGYFVPLLIVAVIILERHYFQIRYSVPFEWLAHGRREFVVLGAAATMLLTTPLSRVPSRSSRRAIIVFQVMFVLCGSVAVFLGPAMIRGQMATLKTNLDRDGVCLQSTGYTCAPASAVTVLRKLGFPADEGAIAIAARTGPFSGTQDDLLIEGLKGLYAKAELAFVLKSFTNITEMRAYLPLMAAIKYDFWTDHMVAVLEVTDKEVILGDPMQGRRVMSHEEFAEIWRSVGVVLRTRGNLAK